VAAEYDESQQIFKAWLPHFSQFTLAEALTSADLLPSVRAFSTDRTTGGATIQYPLETPKGLGGLAPNLSLNYTSVGVDDLYREGGDQHFQTQVSGVGMGWEVGGINRIARADNHLDGDTPFDQREYVLTLNGTFVRIHYQDKAWRTDPEIFAQIDRNGSNDGGRHDYAQWVVTTADGVVYIFGDATVSGTNFNAASATATFAQKQKRGGHERLAKQWYLISVQDRSGNRMDYHYQAEQGVETGCVPSDQAHAYLRWYVRAIYPSEILWSSHPSADPQVNVNPKLHVRFGYATAEREDWNIDYAGDHDCHAVSFAKNNQLTTVTVEAQDANNQWKPLRSYRLTQQYADFPRQRR